MVEVVMLEDVDEADSLRGWPMLVQDRGRPLVLLWFV